MKYLFILLSAILTGCNSQETSDGLELEILTKEVKYKNVAMNDYPKYIQANDVPIEVARTVITYKLKNNSGKTYYFNLDELNFDRSREKFKYEHIKINTAYIDIFDDKGNYQKPRVSLPSLGGFSTEELYKKSLNYDDRRVYLDNGKNFIIHPNETLYFEWFVVLPFGHLLKEANYGVELNPKQNYYAEVLVHSDSLNYKDIISRTDLKTIQENGYEVFNGTIRSKNKIPVVFK